MYNFRGILLTPHLLGLTLQATTPLDPRVLDAMLPYMTEQYGNPHSRTHAYGWEAEAAVDTARKVSRFQFWYYHVPQPTPSPLSLASRRPH